MNLNARALVAALFGGVVLFLWGFVSHMLLPLGETGVHQALDEDAPLMAMKQALPRAGVYLLPGLAPEKMGDAAAVKQYSAKATTQPYAFIVYQPQGRDMTAMGPMLATELMTNIVSALVVVWAMGLVAATARTRITLAIFMGVFAWLTVSVPYWNWYRFPLDFTLAALVSNIVGWTLAGAAMHAWLRRGT